MPRTYRAVLRGDRIEWIDRPPKGENPIRVTVIEDDDTRLMRPNSGTKMADVLEKLAERGGLATRLPGAVL